MSKVMTPRSALKGENSSTMAALQSARPRYFLPATVLILLVGFALRVWHIAATSFWIDELFATFYIESPVGKFLELLMKDGTQVPLYYMLTYFSPSDNDLLFRVSAIMAGLLAIPVMIWIIVRLYGDYQIALAGGVLLATNPFHIMFSRTAHPYSMAFLETLLVSYYFLKLLQGSRSRLIWLGFLLSSMAAYVTHLFALALPLTEYVILGLSLRENRSLFRRWQLAQIIAFIPLVIWTYERLVKVQVGIGTAWIPAPHLGDIPLTVADMGVGYDTTTTWYLLTPALIALALGLGASLVSVVRHPRAKIDDLYWVLLIVFTIMPAFLASYIHPAYVDRYFIVCLPAVVILMLMGWTRLFSSNWQWMALVGIVAVTGTSYTLYMIHTENWERHNWEDAAAYIRANYQPGDGFANDTALWLLCLEHYYQGIPEDQKYLVLDEEAPPPPVDRLWIVYLNPNADVHRLGKMPEFDPFAPDQSALSDWLVARRDQVVDLREFNGVTVILIDLTPS
jgi:4-amino-4-deoxy-L-arabinose transferase-like glycosyltransferase